MKIEHLAIWVNDLESMRTFYTTFFAAHSGDLYVNPKKGFSSFFLTFDGGGSRLELMNGTSIDQTNSRRASVVGLAHFAISVGDRNSVDVLTGRLRSAGYTIHGEPRTTGDGYYESIVLDPEGNHVEITE